MLLFADRSSHNHLTRSTPSKHALTVCSYSSARANPATHLPWRPAGFTDASVRAAIIASAHKVFCAGLDLDIVRGKGALETKQFLERLYFALNDLQYRQGKSTIAAIEPAPAT